MKNKAQQGFSIIELLVALAIIGLLAAIAIPMYMNAQSRAKQGQTMANMRAIATAWELRATEYKAYNAAGATFTVPDNEITYSDLTSMLAPKYIQVLPRMDGFNHALEFRMDQPYSRTSNEKPAQVYTIRSPGRDGIFKGDVGDKTYTQGTFDCFDCDIVFANGQFIARPAGAQH
jgi:prepilin-type N-terminal cleavage/methylation domain-containing protein